jgi:hypothetical protein
MLELLKMGPPAFTEAAGIWHWVSGFLDQAAAPEPTSIAIMPTGSAGGVIVATVAA